MAAKRNWALFALPLIIFVALAVVLGLGLSNDPKVLPSALLNKPLPPFNTPKLLTPEQTVNQNDLKGQIALINVWATWCPSCKQEHAFLNQLKQRGVVIYGVNYKDERQGAIEWLNQYGDPYVLNVFDERGQLGVDLGVYGAPETFLIDANGIIQHRHAGPLHDAVWLKEFVPRIEQLKSGGNNG